MTDHDYIPIYQYEDETISVRIGKPLKGDGAFICFGGNIQFGFTNNQYDDMLLPLLKAIIEERTDGTFKFYKCSNGDYRLQSYALMLVLTNQTGIELQKHAAQALKLVTAE